jgi:hypothetical protein
VKTTWEMWAQVARDIKVRCRHDGVKWISVAQDGVLWRAFVNTESAFGFNKRNFLFNRTIIEVLWRKLCHELISHVLVEHSD